MNADEILRFAGGEAFAVDPDAIERELASLWQAAGQENSKAAPVTRACLLNVIALLEEREGLEGFGSADRLQSWIDELPRYVAARALVVRSQPFQMGQDELQSWISANCIIAGSGGKLVCSEEVTIAARGSGDHHVPGLVRALLVPGLPTNLLVRGVPHGALAEPLLQLADRVVSDVDASSHQRPLRTLARRVKEGQHRLMDMGWVGTAGLRAALAGAFDPPFDGDSLMRVQRLRCATPPHAQWSSRLVLGWLTRAIGAEQIDPSYVGPPDTTRFVRPSGPALDIEVQVDPSLPGPRFIFEAEAWSEPVQVSSLGTHVEVTGPHLPTTRRPRQELDGPAGLARALVNRAEDTAFHDASEIAERLP
ncbi:MAG: glucose-6-phosphate dehydrogenase assembly protein OpcA [Myxococcota bacterium]